MTTGLPRDAPAAELADVLLRLVAGSVGSDRPAIQFASRSACDARGFVQSNFRMPSGRSRSLPARSVPVRSGNAEPPSTGPTRRAPGLVWADIPFLPDAIAETLAKIAGKSDLVHHLRRSVAGALRQVCTDDLATVGSTATDLAHELTARGEELREDLRRCAVTDVGGAATLALGSVVVGVTTFGPRVALAALLAGAGNAVGAAHGILAGRKKAWYAFWWPSAESGGSDQPGRRETRQRSVSSSLSRCWTDTLGTSPHGRAQ